MSAIDRVGLQMLQEDHDRSWTHCNLCKNLIEGQGSAIFLKAESINLMKVVNSSTAIVWEHTTFVEGVRALVIYDDSFLAQ